MLTTYELVAHAAIEWEEGVQLHLDSFSDAVPVALDKVVRVLGAVGVRVAALRRRPGSRSVSQLHGQQRAWACPGQHWQAAGDVSSLSNPLGAWGPQASQTELDTTPARLELGV